MTGPIRVLVVGPKYACHNSRGGMATVVTLMREHRDPRVRVTTVATYLDDPAWLRLATGVAGVLRAVTHIVRGRADVVHIHLAHGGSVVRKSIPLLAARLKRVPTVVHAHSFDFAGWFDTLPTWGRAVVRQMLRADAWLVLGEGLVEPYQQRLRIAPESIRAVVNPAPLVPRSEVPVQAQPQSPATPPERIDPDAPDMVRAIGLGRMGERKGTFDLLEALALLDPVTRRTVHVVLAGDGEVEAVREEITRRGLGDLVEALDWLEPPERDTLLRSGQVFLLPSHAEGMPMALLEAMGAGLVPVVTAVGAVAEVARDDDNAVLVPASDPAALAEAIRQVVSDPERRGRLAGSARATAVGLGVGAWFEELVLVWRRVVEHEDVDPSADLS